LPRPHSGILKTPFFAPLMLKPDEIAAILISILLALAFTWIALLSRDHVLLALAWFVALLVAGLSILEERTSGGGEEGAT